MSFDIFFQPCRFTGKPVEMKNLFTGEVQLTVPNQTLTADELAAVQRVLHDGMTDGPDEFGCYRVQLPDGGSAEVYGNDLVTGCMVSLRGLSPDLAGFLMDMLKAGNWVMLPAMEESMAITASPDRVTGVPDGFPKIVVCNAVDELGALLSAGFGAWQRYRDQVTGG